MGKKDPRVDAYIAKSPDFARPILVHVRSTVHAACPKAEETIKWGVPFFVHEGILCSVAGFKKHCMFILWNKALRAQIKTFGLTPAQLKKLHHITSIDELPDAKTLKQLIKRSAALNAAGEKGPPRRSVPKKKLPVPADLRKALATNKKARAAFAAFSPSKKRDYIQWISEAKRDETRAKRLATAVGWIAEGKARNWKYEKC